MLRQLAGYHQRDPNCLFLVRLAQGLTHMGKGTLTLHPYHSDRQLLCLPSLAALLVTCFAFLDARNCTKNSFFAGIQSTSNRFERSFSKGGSIYRAGVTIRGYGSLTGRRVER